MDWRLTLEEDVEKVVEMISACQRFIEVPSCFDGQVDQFRDFCATVILLVNHSFKAYDWSDSMISIGYSPICGTLEGFAPYRTDTMVVFPKIES
jgi:hypothetical protein